jgi:hypothetical protein
VVFFQGVDLALWLLPANKHTGVNMRAMSLSACWGVGVRVCACVSRCVHASLHPCRHLDIWHYVLAGTQLNATQCIHVARLKLAAVQLQLAGGDFLQLEKGALLLRRGFPMEETVQILLRDAEPRFAAAGLLDATPQQGPGLKVWGDHDAECNPSAVRIISEDSGHL